MSTCQSTYCHPNKVLWCTRPAFPSCPAKQTPWLRPVSHIRTSTIQISVKERCKRLFARHLRLPEMSVISDNGVLPMHYASNAKTQWADIYGVRRTVESRRSATLFPISWKVFRCLAADQPRKIMRDEQARPLAADRWEMVIWSGGVHGDHNKSSPWAHGAIAKFMEQYSLRSTLSSWKKEIESHRVYRSPIVLIHCLKQ